MPSPVANERKRKADFSLLLKPPAAKSTPAPQADIRTLKERIEEDLESSYDFEKRLKEAMGQNY